MKENVELEGELVGIGRNIVIGSRREQDLGGRENYARK